MEEEEVVVWIWKPILRAGGGGGGVGLVAKSKRWQALAEQIKVPDERCSPRPSGHIHSRGGTQRGRLEVRRPR